MKPGLLRLILGFALAPLASGILQMLVMGIGGIPIIIFSYPFALGLGIPAFFVARHMGLLSLRYCILGGASLGGLTGVLLAFAMGGVHAGAPSIMLGFALLSVHGGVVGGAFWMVALWRHDTTPT